MEKLTHADFEPYLNQKFAVSDGASAIEAELASVTPAKWSPENGRTPFSLIFRAAYPPILIQRMYQVSHDGLGSYAIFLVPIGPDRVKGGMQYEAVFG